MLLLHVAVYHAPLSGK